MGASGFWVGRDEVNGGALREKATEDRYTHYTAQRQTAQKPDHRGPVVCDCWHVPSVNVRRLWVRSEVQAMATKAGPACLGRCPSGYSGRTRRFVGKELAGCWDPTGHTLRATAGYLATPISGLPVLW